MTPLTTNGITVDVETFGQGPPVLLLAATGMVNESWLPARVPALVAVGRQVVIMDTRGRGGSDAPEPPYTIDQLADDAAGVITALDLAPCAVVGNSLGGMVAERLLSRHPTLIGSATLLAAARPMSAYGRLVAEGTAEADAAGVELPPQLNVAVMLGLLLTSGQLRDDALVTGFAERLLTLPPWVGPGRRGQRTAGLDGDLDTADRARWPDVGHPV